MQTSAADDRFRLSVHTSMLCEFRNASGKLGVFELNRRFTSVGSLCNALGRLPGVRLEREGSSLWTSGPARISFNNRLFEVSAPFSDVRVAPVEKDGPFPETEELLRLIRENIMPTWYNRARPRY